MRKTLEEAVLFATILLASTAAYGAETTALAAEWQGRVIPCPKTCKVAAVHPARPEDVALIVPDAPEPKYDTIRGLLAPFAAATAEDAPFRIVFTLSGNAGNALPENAANVLATVPNADQACVIVSISQAGAFGGLLVCANTDLGLLYGARTLSQMLKAEPGTVPELALTDWPDMPERGQWGGSSTRDLAWLAARKFNVVEAHASLSCDDNGNGIGSLPEDMRREAVREGIKLVPIILHLEQIMTNDELRKRLPGLASTPNPAVPVPSDYTPGICFSNPDAIRILGDWMESLVRLPEISEVMLWLSEDAAPCFCPACDGREPFTVEVAAAVQAFERAKAVKPGASLRLLLTQGSYPVNELVLKAAPPDVKISYYHGGYTYDSSDKPMIYPLLESFAQSGRWLGVYPQVTNAWRTVTPFTGPQFIRARMTEFVEKRLSNVIVYAVPSNDLHDFNVTAAAEWLWNNKGRDEAGFARAWARAHGIAEPDRFAEWAVAVGPVGWKLAGSRTAITLIGDTGAAYTKGGHPFGFGEWILGAIASEEEMISLRRQADDALDRAMKLGYGPAIAESRIHQAYLDLSDGLRLLSQAPAAGASEPASPGNARYRAAFEQVDAAARTLEIEHVAWARAIDPGPFHSRLVDTMASGFRAAGAAVDVLRRSGIPDPAPEFRSKNVGEWSTVNFADGSAAVLTFDLAETWYGPGPYVLTFEYHGGLHGIRITRLECVAVAPDGSETPLTEAAGAAQGNIPAGETNAGGMVNIYEPWREVRFHLPALPSHAAPRVRVGVELLEDAPPEQRVSNGAVLLRRDLCL
ncbi:MAG TPA: hypothetical protein PKJ78_16295 [Candidatus Hydrogenedentes bacterium]|nr:hypothetical protein [Candidatus Hydrogenedentota bacterium]